MPITTDQAADRRGALSVAELMMEEVLPDVRSLISERAEEMRQKVYNELWVNERVGNNPPQMSGRPSESTGRSASEWYAVTGAGLHELRIELVNPIDYAPYVRFPGDPEGQCLEDTEQMFEAVTNELTNEIQDLVRDYFGP